MAFLLVLFGSGVSYGHFEQMKNIFLTIYAFLALWMFLFLFSVKIREKHDISNCFIIVYSTFIFFNHKTLFEFICSWFSELNYKNISVFNYFIRFLQLFSAKKIIVCSSVRFKVACAILYFNLKFQLLFRVSLSS